MAVTAFGFHFLEIKRSNITGAHGIISVKIVRPRSGLSTPSFHPHFTGGGWGLLTVADNRYPGRPLNEAPSFTSPTCLFYRVYKRLQ